MPRTQTKGVRLLIDVKQPADGTVEIDDLMWVEWRTPWISPSDPVESPHTIQATHLQIQE